jgi:hypothetical protein
LLSVTIVGVDMEEGRERKGGGRERKGERGRQAEGRR